MTRVAFAPARTPQRVPWRVYGLNNVLKLNPPIRIKGVQPGRETYCRKPTLFLRDEKREGFRHRGFDRDGRECERDHVNPHEVLYFRI